MAVKRLGYNGLHSRRGMAEHANSGWTSALLAHTPQVVLLVGSDLRVEGEHSRFAAEVLGGAPADGDAPNPNAQGALVGRDYPELLLPGDDRAEARQLLRDWLELVFARSDLEWKTLAELNPCEQIELSESGRGTHLLRFSYCPLANANGRTIERLLVLGSDTTERRDLEEQMAARERESQEKLDIAAQILKLDVSILRQFLSETRTLISEMRARLAGLPFLPDRADALNTIFRKLHTIKGNARALGFEWLGREAHAAEDALSPLRARPDAVDATAVKPVGERVQTLYRIIQAYEKVADEVVGAAPDRGEARGRRKDLAVPVSLGRLEALLTLVQGARAVAAQRPLTADAEENLDSLLARTEAALGAIRKDPVRRLLRRFPKMVADLAEELGKQVQETAILGGDLLVDVHLLDRLGDALVHIVRNAVDHGIEESAARLARGKPEAGRIEIEVHEHRDQLVVEVRDDGRGVDIKQVARKAIALGLIDERKAAVLDPNEVLDLLTSPGFTTAPTTTDISGRGVGLDVARRAVEDLGGRFFLESEPGRGCCVRLWVPLAVGAPDAAGAPLIAGGGSA